MTPPVKPDKSIGQMLHENLSFMRANPQDFGDDDIKAEITKAQQAIDRQNAKEKALGPAEQVAGQLTSVGSGMTFGAQPYVNATLRTMLSEGAGGDKGWNLPAAVADEKAKLAQFRGEHPGKALTAELAGAVTNPVSFFGRAPAAAGRLRQMLQPVAEGVAQGTAAGTLNADSKAGDVAAGAAKGGAAGGTLAAMLGLAGAAGRGVANVFRTPDARQAALERVTDLMRTAEQTPTTLRTKAAQVAGEGGQPVLAELMGPQSARALRASTNAVGSTGGQVAADVLNARAAHVGRRADQALRTATGIGDEAPGFVRDVNAAYRTETTRPLFERASTEARGLEAAPERAAADVRRVNQVAGQRALPAPGQSVSAKTAIPAGSEGAWADVSNDLPIPGTPPRVPRETIAQEMGREALVGRGAQSRLEAQGGERRVIHGPLDAGVRRPPVSDALPPVQGPSVADRGAIAHRATAEAHADPTVQSFIHSIRSQDPRLKGADPTSYEFLHEVQRQMNEEWGKVANTPNAAGPEWRALNAARAKVKAALESKAPTHAAANAEWAGQSVSKDVFDLGTQFHTMDPYDIKKMLGTGYLPNGKTKMAPEDVQQFKAGVAQAVRDLLGAKTASESLEGAASHKNPLGALNSKQLDDQLKAALGGQYEAMMPTIRQLWTEEAFRNQVLGGSNTAQKLSDEGVTAGGLLGDIHHGIGFGPKAVARRVGMRVVAAPLEDLLAGRLGKQSTELTKLLTAGGGRGSTLEDVIAELEAAQRTGRPRSIFDDATNALTRTAGSVAGRP